MDVPYPPRVPGSTPAERSKQRLGEEERLTPCTTKSRCKALGLVLLLGAMACAPAPGKNEEEGTHRHLEGLYRFEDVTNENGLAEITRTWGAAWTDVEDDGDPDVFLVRHWREPRVFLWDDQWFKPTTTAPDLAGTQMDRHQCTWGEANQDGRPDLFCTQGADRGQGRGPNQLLINRGGVLEDKAAQYGVTYPRGRGRTASWLDYDLDGDLDVFHGTTERAGFPSVLFERGRKSFKKVRVGLQGDLSVLSSSWADWDRDHDFDLLVTQHQPFHAVAFENVRGVTFRRIPLRGVTGRYWTSSTWGDFNGDGWTDLQVVSRDKVRIFRNRRGQLRPVFKTRLQEGRSGTWFDVDNDGDLDSFVVQGAPGNSERPGVVNEQDVLLVRKGGTFEKIRGPSFRGPETGNGETAMATDYNRDGRVDIFVTNGLHQWKGPLQLLENQSEAGHWAGIDVVGSRKNPLGYGVTVRWKAEGRVRKRQLTDEVVFKGQSEVGYVHLGLGNAESALVKVFWPRGGKDCLRVEAGAVERIQKGSTRC